MNYSHITTGGPDSSPHFKQHHLQRRVIAICFVCALTLGTVGYKQYDNKIHLVDALYHAAQHFMMHAPHLDRDRS